jgi:hypothetical protein
VSISSCACEDVEGWILVYDNIRSKIRMGAINVKLWFSNFSFSGMHCLTLARQQHAFIKAWSMELVPPKASFHTAMSQLPITSNCRWALHHQPLILQSNQF